MVILRVQLLRGTLLQSLKQWGSDSKSKEKHCERGISFKKPLLLLSLKLRAFDGKPRFINALP